MKKETDSQDVISLQKIVLRILVALTIFAFGGLVSMFTVNRLLVTQVAIYGETHMAAASAIINFMDDIAPYLAAYIVSSLVMTLATVVVWLWGKVQFRNRWYKAALLALVMVIVIVWLISGQKTEISSVPLMTPTPIP
jgi:hypothetical protein